MSFLSTLYDRFRRVVFRREGVLEDQEVARRMAEHSQILCIVNSRRAAQEIFRLLPREGSFHLSTLMVPAHRQSISRRDMRADVNTFMQTVLNEEPLDASLVDFDDDECW